MSYIKILCLLLVLCLLFVGCSPAQAPDATTPSKCADGHIDEGNDGFCDRCSEFLLVMVDFYALNDIHGKLADADTHLGLDELSTYLENARNTDDHAIFLNAGDMWQGASESNLTHGRIMVDWMNEMGFAAMAIGNHEYDWGEAPIEENAQFAQFPFLAINIYDRETNQQVSYCKSSTVVDLGQLQIGIIGAVGDCYSSISSDKVTDVYFKTGSELTQLVKHESDMLREAGADFIVYVLHDGLGSNKTGSVSDSMLKSYYDVALSDGYVDLVFEGHTHRKYVITDSYGVYHLQGGGDNEGISHVEVAINIATGKPSVQTAELVEPRIYAHEEDHPIVSELLDKYADSVDKGNEILGTNNYNRNSKYMQQLVADLYYQAGEEIWGDEYDIALGGGFISIRDPGYLAAGDVSYKMLYSLFPFDNQLVLCSIKGKDLLDRFYNTTNNRYFISYGEYGRYLEQNIEYDETYYVVVDSYSSLYGPNKLTEIERYDAEVYARDLLAQYAKEGGFQNY
ncbi:MAG: bifunctional metallophosphatase/5'-nucleotidase [Oscillospiraceae bacterium]|nr:bifunctional metallophosphatase/5'-nucleotidase [Oscillospiraceae bacterium]